MWRIIFKNFWFKLAASLMALLLWFHVATDKTYEYQLAFPLEISNLPQRLVLTEKIPEQIEVKIRGKGKELLKLLLAERKSLLIDAKEFKNGETNYVIKRAQIPIPEGLELEVTDIPSFQDLKIKLDYLQEKKVRVEPNISILPKEGFVQVGELHYTPKEVMISGPRMWVMKVESINTRKKVIENVDKSVSDQVDLALPQGYNLKLSTLKMNFSADIQKAIERKIINLQVESFNMPKYREIEIQPKNISVTVVGAESLVSQIVPEMIKVSIDCSKTKRRETFKLPVLVELPKEIYLKKVEPDSIEVLVK